MLNNTGRNAGFTLVEFGMVITVFFLMIAFLMPVVGMLKGRAHRINCGNNLMLISLALHSYAADHNDTFPNSLGELYPVYIKDRKIFDCPAAKSPGTPEMPDYGYVTGLTEASPEETVIATDLPGNHGRRGKNILRIDGSVEWVNVIDGKTH